MELQAKDLRIGNWHIWDLTTCQVDASVLSTMSYGNLTSKPIPLTEEWYDKISNNATIDFWFWFCGGKCEFIIDAGDHSSYLKEIKYVHQAQNIWFSHAEEELTIKD